MRNCSVRGNDTDVEYDNDEGVVVTPFLFFHVGEEGLGAWVLGV